MRSLKRALACMTAVAALNVQAQGVSPPAVFHGTGRACYGSLSISPKSITWNTPFNQCQAASYTHTEHGDYAGHTRDSYLLNKTNKACRFRVLSLTHADDKSAEIGWEISAYGSEASYNADKASGYTASTPDMMSCYLVRAVKRRDESSPDNLHKNESLGSFEQRAALERSDTRHDHHDQSVWESKLRWPTQSMIAFKLPYKRCALANWIPCVK